MKLPWDGKYLKISFHVIFTAVIVYLIFMLMDSAAYILTNLEDTLGGLGGVFGWFFSAFSVLVISFVIAYILNPLVDFFQRLYEGHITNIFKRLRSGYASKKIFVPIKTFFKKIRPGFLSKRSEKVVPVFKKRTAGTALTYLFILLLLSVLLAAVYIQINGMNSKVDDDGFSESLVISFDKTRNEIEDMYTKLRATFEEWGVSDGIQDIVSNFVEGLKQFIQELSVSIVPVITSVGGKVLDFFMSLAIAFYFLRDKDAIKHKLREIFELIAPRRIKRGIMTFLADTHAVFSGYIIGQLTDALIMAVLLSAGLSLAGVNFAVIIGVFSGFMNIIPYFGAIAGFVLSILVSVISGDYLKAVYAGIVVIVLQQIDGMFIVPRVVGKKVELGPALVMLSLAIGGSLFGFKGLLFAVPVCAILKVFGLKFMERVRNRRAGN